MTRSNVGETVLRTLSTLLETLSSSESVTRRVASTALSAVWAARSMTFDSRKGLSISSDMTISTVSSVR